MSEAEAARARSRRWRERNPEHARELSRVRAARWRASHPEAYAAAVARWRESWRGSAVEKGINLMRRAS